MGIFISLLHLQYSAFNGWKKHPIILGGKCFHAFFTEAVLNFYLWVGMYKCTQSNSHPMSDMTGLWAPCLILKQWGLHEAALPLVLTVEFELLPLSSPAPYILSINSVDPQNLMMNFILSFSWYVYIWVDQPAPWEAAFPVGLYTLRPPRLDGFLTALASTYNLVSPMSFCQVTPPPHSSLMKSESTYSVCLLLSW